MSRLGRLVGNHGYAVGPILTGRHAGRYFIAFNFWGRWQLITDEDTGELRTWKTEEEALGNAEAWRWWCDHVRLPAQYDARKA